MQFTPAKIVLAAVVVGLLGFGGVQVNRSLTCQGFEEDYLNSVSGLKSNAATSDLFNDKSVTKAFDTMREIQTEKAKSALVSLYEQCGDRAAETATRKGSEMLLRM